MLARAPRHFSRFLYFNDYSGNIGAFVFGSFMGVVAERLVFGKTAPAPYIRAGFHIENYRVFARYFGFWHFNPPCENCLTQFYHNIVTASVFNSTVR
jgi:hypothetical protein